MAQALPHADQDIILIPQHLQELAMHAQETAYNALLILCVLNVHMEKLFLHLEHAWNAWKTALNVTHLMSIFATIVVLDTI